MRTRTKKIFISVFSFFCVFIFAGDVFAKYGLDETAGYAGLKEYGTSVPDLIGRVIGAGLSMVSVVFFALMIYAGISYMLSRGNEESAKKAINMIWAAIIGILIVLASYALTSFVFKAIGGEPVAAPATTTAEGKYFCPTGEGTACFESDAPSIAGVDCYTTEDECKSKLLNATTGGSGVLGAECSSNTDCGTGLFCGAIDEDEKTGFCAPNP